ncbi:MAG: hypothetical protein IJQ36_05530 [Oscillospiraceae bacterium]|nr:hypothetical protein [Oscillospiraceae bacterium]
MTRTQFTDACRNVRRQIIPWISIVVIGMASLIAYLSLVYCSEAIRLAASEYYETYNFWDLEIASSMLLDEEDLAVLRAMAGVESAEPVWTVGTKLLNADADMSVTVQSLPDTISLPELLEGRLPEKAGECAIELPLHNMGFAVGDSLCVANSSVAGVEPLRVTEYMITGIIRHPDHISFELPEAPYVLVTKDSFNQEGLDGAFMKVRLRAAGTPDQRYSAAYEKTVEPLAENAASIMEERATARTEKLRADSERKLDEGWQQLDEASAKLEEGARMLEEGAQQLREGDEKLASSRQQLDDGWSQLKDAEAQLDTAQEKLDVGAHALVDAQYQIAAMEGLIYKADGAIGALSGEDGGALPGAAANALQQARDGAKAYNSGRDQWYSGGEEYLDALTEYEQGKKRLEQGEQEYESGKAQLEEKKADYAEKEQEYEEKKAEYDDGLKQLEQAEIRLNNLGPYRWMQWSDLGNAGYVFTGNQAHGLSSMSYSFSILFLVIAALVIYATVGRMIQEQRAQVGTSKALGLYNREILGKYMFFGVSAAVTAAVLGVALTYYVVQERFLSNYEPFFVFEKIPRCFRPAETAVVMLILPLAAAISVWFACSSLIRIPAIRLLQGEQPTTKRKAQRHMSTRGLYTRLIFRNLRTDLRRVLVTIVSIAGCCHLLVGGFMIKFAIERVNERQFGQIIQYQAELRFDPSVTEASRRLADILEENELPFVPVAKYDFIFRNGPSISSATAITAEPDSLEGFYGLRDPESGTAVRAADGGVLIPMRMSEYHGLMPGDSLTAYDSSFAPHEIPISGVFDNHFGNILFFTPACYEKVFGTQAGQNCFLIRTNGMSLEALEAKVSGVEGFLELKDATADRARLDRMSSVLNAAMLMLLGLAAVMAYFIVMNLSVTYIQKKTRELTIMRINGFTVRECVAYVSWDLIVTTLAGILLGLVAGHILGERVLPVTEGPFMRFVHEPDLRTYLYAALITAGFSALVSSTALRRVKDLKLSDII